MAGRQPNSNPLTNATFIGVAYKGIFFESGSESQINKSIERSIEKGYNRLLIYALIATYWVWM